MCVYAHSSIPQADNHCLSPDGRVFPTQQRSSCLRRAKDMVCVRACVRVRAPACIFPCHTCGGSYWIVTYRVPPGDQRYTEQGERKSYWMKLPAVINLQPPSYCFTHLFAPNISFFSNFRVCPLKRSNIMRAICLLSFVESRNPMQVSLDLLSLCHIAIFRRAQNIFFFYCHSATARASVAVWNYIRC